MLRNAAKPPGMLDIDQQTSSSHEREVRARNRLETFTVLSYWEQMEAVPNDFEFQRIPMDLDEIVRDIPEGGNVDTIHGQKITTFTTSRFADPIFPRPILADAVLNRDLDPKNIDTKKPMTWLYCPSDISNTMIGVEAGKDIFTRLLEHRKKKQRSCKQGVPLPKKWLTNESDSETEVLSGGEEEEEMPVVEDLTPQDLLDVTPNGIAARNRFDEELKRELSKTDNPHLEFIEFLETKSERMRRVVRIYKSHRHTLKLQPVDAKKHWRRERLSREDHDKRFTRWDCTMAEAWADDAKEEIETLNNGGFVGLRGDESTYCQNMCEAFEHRVNRELELETDNTDDKFYFEKFALADVLERKEDVNGKFFPKAVAKIFNGSIKDGIKRLFIGQQKWGKVKTILTRHGLHWESIIQDLQDIVLKNLTLPKGQLYCRLLLNVAGLTYYDVKYDVWRSEKFNDQELERRMFQGIPFDSQGNPFNFAVQQPAATPQ